VAVLYKRGLTAKQILEVGICGISSIGSIYFIIAKENAKRTPGLIRAKKGYENEDEKILKKIKELKPKFSSFRKLAEYLNDHNYRTVTNKPFSYETVRLKYYQSLKKIFHDGQKQIQGKVVL
jgi:hypothetical protein